MLPFDLIQLFEECDFCRRSFSSWRDFFSYCLVFGADPKNLFFVEDSPGEKRT